MFPVETGVGGVEPEREEGPAQVYDLNSTLLMEAEDATPDLSPLPAGLYIVRTGAGIRKVRR